jgi:hypothetical protein
MKFRFDEIERMDDGSQLNAFFSRQLEHIRPQIFDIRYPTLKGRIFVPINSSMSNGAEEYTYRYFDEVGEAKPVRDYATDFPRVDIKGEEATQKVRSIGDSYGWSIQEARAAMMAGLSLDVRKARAARNAIERKIDRILLLGSTEFGFVMRGLFNLDGVITFSVPNGAGGDTEFESKTPDEILSDMHAVSRKVVVDSLEMEKPDTMIVPLSTYGHISTTRMGDGDARTILAKFLADEPHVKRVETSHLLETAGAGGTKRMVVYERSPDKLEGLIPQEFEQFPPQFRGMEVITHCHARIGGVVLYYPKSVAYADGI